MVSDRIQRRFRIKHLWEANIPVFEILRQTGEHKSFVYRWIHRFENEQTAEDKPRPGAPKKVSNTIGEKICRRMRGKRGYSLRQTTRLLAIEDNINIGRETIRNYLSSIKWKSRAP